MTQKHAVETTLAPSALGTYSQAIVTGEFAFISGQIGLDPKSMVLVSDSIDSEIRQIFNNLNEIIKQTGATIDHVVKFTVYLTNLHNFGAVNQTMEALLQPPYPARAAIGISQLPQGANVEIDAIVYLPKIR